MNAQEYRVVIADADDAHRTHLSDQLEDAGYRVDAFSRGEDAIWHGEFTPCHALILDENLTDIDAFEVCANVRRCWQNMDAMIVIMTDATDTLTHNYIEQMTDYAGADFFCTKPCDHRVLVALLDELDMANGTEDTVTPLTGVVSGL